MAGYEDIREKLFSVLEEARSSIADVSDPTKSAPPVGGGVPERGPAPSRSSLDSRLDRLEARLDDLESVLMDIQARISSSSPVEQYTLDILDRVQHVQTMLADLYKKTADLPSVKDELADLKSAVESLRAELRDISSQLRALSTQKPSKDLSPPKARSRGPDPADKWKDLL